MLNGSLTGTVSGLAVSAAILVAASQVAPRVDLSVADAPPEIPVAVMPDPAPVVEETQIRTGVVVAPLPTVEAEESMPSVDTTSVEVPVSETVDAMLDVPSITATPTVTLEAEGVILPPPESVRPEAPQQDESLLAVAAPVEEIAAPVDEAAEPLDELAEPVDEEELNLEENETAIATLDEEEAPPSLPPVNFASPLTPGLDQPRLITPDIAEGEVALPASSTAEEVVPGAPAIDAFSVPFELTADRPSLGIVLVDQPSAFSLDFADLAFPIAVAIDPLAADAAIRMASLRAQGVEVLVLTPLPEGAGPADVEVAFESFLSAVPEAVGVMDVPQAVLQDSRPRASQVVEIMQSSGHGIVTYNKGLNSLLQIADGANVPALSVARVFDEGGVDIAKMKRSLDQGAFKSGVDGRALMVGQLSAEALDALSEWSTSNRAGTVQLAPVSAVLKAN